ncbi:MAG: hypothetical protein GC189_10185 [Alphaproteobacteria bacterium]|nr:hypothetical protein [Alphaproteobacteria bacterium]
MKRFAWMFVCVGAALASGCISLFPDPAPAARIYSLTAPSDAARAAQTAPAVISVAEPTGAEALMGDDIVWRTDGVVAFVGGAQWTSSTPGLLQALVVRTLMERGGVAAAVRVGDGVRADAELRWDLMDFQIVEGDGALDARFAANLTLIDARTRRVLAVRAVETSRPLASRTQRDAAAALSAAAQEGATEIAAFIEANAPLPPPQS